MAVVESSIESRESAVDLEQAAVLVRLSQAIRRLETPGLREVSSTRVLISAGKLIGEGLSMREAARAAIVGPLVDDAKVAQSLTKLIDVYLPE